jgi:tetratricopeptide (TPR) repeat protein
LNADSKVATGALIYLTAVKNETGEKPLDNLTELIQADLTQSAQIDLLDQGRAGDILQQMTKAPDTVVDPSVAREIAMRAGAVRVVFARLTGSNGDYRLDIDIEQPDNSPAFYREHWPRSFSWHNASAPISNDTIPPDLLKTVRTASDWIRTKAGESKNDIARLDVPPGDATTGSWEALGDYAQAKKLMMQGRRLDAVTALDRALRIDPEFALAYAMRGDVLFSLHRETEGRKSYADALDAGIHDRLTRREEDRIRGMRAVDSEDYEIAVDVFHDLTLNYPTDLEGWVYPSSALRMLNRNDEAIANLRRAVTLAPDSSFAPYALGQELLIEGRYEEVPKWIDFLRKRNHPENADELESADLFLSHDYQGARRALAAIGTSTSPIRRSYSYRDIADLDAENGNAQSAIDELDQGLLEDKERGDQEQYAAKLLGKAYLECRLMRFESCLHDEHAGFVLSPTLEHALAADSVLGLAIEESSESNLAGLQHELQEILRQEPDDFGRRSEEVKLRTSGALQLAEGQPQDALRTMTIAATKDAPAGNREYLGQVLLAVAKISHDKAKTRELLRRAQAAYAAVALHPALILCDPGIGPPGNYGDQLEDYLRVSRQLDDDTESVQQARKDLLALRPNRLTNSVQ